MVFGFNNPEKREYVEMVDKKAGLTELLSDGQRYVPQALDVVMHEVDENDVPYDFSKGANFDDFTEKACLLYLDRKGYGHLDRVSPAIKGVSFEDDRVRVQLGGEQDDVYIRTRDEELIEKLKLYEN